MDADLAPDGYIETLDNSIKVCLGGVGPFDAAHSPRLTRILAFHLKKSNLKMEQIIAH